jgi:hypothetical protein
MRVGWIRKSPDGWEVSASDEDSGYDGPVAEVIGGKTWVNIITCPYEGNAMINIEALPQLIEALNNVALTLAQDGLA